MSAKMLTDEEALAVLRQWHEENAVWRVIARKSPVSINVEAICIGVSPKAIAFEVGSQEEPLYIDWARLNYYFATPKMVKDLFIKNHKRNFSACLMADITWPEVICFMKAEPDEANPPIEAETENHSEFTRQVALALLDTTAHQMAARQLLYDAGISSEERYQQTYTSILKGQFEALRAALQTSDGARVMKIIEALSKSPHKT